jgi:hypothetical protein
MVMTKEEVALEVMEGRSSRKEHAPRRVGLCEERVLASYMLVKRTKRRRKKNRGKEQEGRTRYMATSRSAEICARKWGELESCVAHRKWRRIGVCASCDA